MTNAISKSLKLSLTIVFLGTLTTSCSPNDEKLYSRRGLVKAAPGTEIESKVAAISNAIDAPVRDRQRDVDAYPMFLLSNRDVTIFVRKKFDEACEPTGRCEWKYDVSATNNDDSGPRQRERVDRAYNRIADALD